MNVTSLSSLPHIAQSTALFKCILRTRDLMISKQGTWHCESLAVYCQIIVFSLTLGSMLEKQGTWHRESLAVYCQIIVFIVTLGSMLGKQGIWHCL